MMFHAGKEIFRNIKREHNFLPDAVAQGVAIAGFHAAPKINAAIADAVTDNRGYKIRVLTVYFFRVAANNYFIFPFIVNFHEADNAFNYLIGRQEYAERTVKLV